MPNIFQSVAVNKIRKSLFNLSHFRKYSSNLGALIPIQCTEVLPNETFHTRHEAVVKFSPLLAPMMQECDMFIEDFFVPNRLVWSNWEKFITPSDDGTFPAMPYYTLNYSNRGRLAVGSLADYMGLPVGEDLPINNVPFSTLPFRAYTLIWNEYYRDQNLQAEANIEINRDGIQEISDIFQLRRRCWPKDYFTSALPNTQRGGDVTLPMSGDAKVGFSVSGNDAIADMTASATGSSNPKQINLSVGLNSAATGVLKADLSNVNSATINELRQAVALQEYLELNMRVGGRPNEYILGNFGQHVQDYRIDRPQFIGGFRQPIQVMEVDQTSATEQSLTPLATQAGLAYGVGSTKTLKYHSYEHGWLISLMSVLPKASYQQGLPRKFSRMEPLDFANPKFGNLGEQAILNKEIYVRASNPNGTFGYTPRYSEYKYEPSTVHGEFKTTLNYWHMGRIFATEPALNSTFVESVPSDRPFAVVDGNDKIRVQIYNKCKALRPLPYYGTPKLI